MDYSLIMLGWMARFSRSEIYNSHTCIHCTLPSIKKCAQHTRRTTQRPQSAQQRLPQLSGPGCTMSWGSGKQHSSHLPHHSHLLTTMTHCTAGMSAAGHVWQKKGSGNICREKRLFKWVLCKPKLMSRSMAIQWPQATIYNINFMHHNLTRHTT